MKKRTAIWFGVAAGVIIAAAIVIAIIIDVGNNKPNSRASYEHTITYYYTDADASTRFICDAQLLENKLAGNVDAFMTVDGTVAIARAGTGLYRITSAGITLIHPVGVDRAMLSTDSKIIAYTTATQAHIYDSETDITTDIKPDNAVSIPSLAISPDCATIGLTAKDSNGEYCAYSHIDGRLNVLSRNAYIVAIADNAEFWYYVDTVTGDFFYATPKSQKKLGTDVGSYFEFNRDLTETTFDMNSVTYCSKRGGKAKALVDGETLFSTVAECSSTQGGSSYISYVRDCDTLLNGVFYNMLSSSSDPSARNVYNLWYVNARMNATKLCGKAYQFSITKSGEYVICLIDDVLYRMESDNPNTARRLASEVYMYVSSTDGRDIYCISYDATLYYIRDYGNALAIMSNASYCLLTSDNKCLCITDYEETGALNYIDGTFEKRVVGEAAFYIETSPNYACYYSAPYNDDNGNRVYDLYTSADGTNFVLALRGVTLYGE